MANPKILIIEDDRSLADVLVYNLRQAGFETLLATDGQDGINQALAKAPAKTSALPSASRIRRSR